MIRYATPDLIPALKEIWNLSFGDSYDYIDFLFERILPPERILMATAPEGAPAAMLCLQPFNLWQNGGAERAEGMYVFGVATHPAHRGKGYSTALLEETHRLLADDGIQLSALVPDGESLFRFYGNRGYETAFSIKKLEISAASLEDAQPLSLRPARLEELASLRDDCFGGRSAYVRWDEDYLRFIGEECTFLDGKVYAFSDEFGPGYAVCYHDENQVILKEIAAPPQSRNRLLAALRQAFGADRYVLYLPADDPWESKKILPFAMVRWYDRITPTLKNEWHGHSPWIAHVLDS